MEELNSSHCGFPYYPLPDIFMEVCADKEETNL